MKTIEFNGSKYEYDETLFSSWRWQRAVSGAYGSEEACAAVDALFEDPEAVYDSVGDDVASVMDLLAAISEDAGDPKGSKPSRQRFAKTSRR